MSLALGGVGGEGGERRRGLNLVFTNPVGTGRVLDMCLYLGCGGVGGVGGEWVGACTRVWMGGVVFCVDGRSRYLYIVLGEYLRILSVTIVQSCCTL